jgi:uncharacterized protein (PEP-CTERM system associated)
VESTITDNVDLAPAERQRADWVNQFTPRIAFSEIGARSKFSGTLAAPMLVYTRSSKNNYIAPEAAVSGTYQAIEHFLFIDANARVSQQYLSPFGPRSVTLASATQNRYTAQSYSVSPYIRGGDRGGLTYELRQQSIWADAAGASLGTSTNKSYTSNVSGQITQAPRPGGWSVEYRRSDIHFTELTAGFDTESMQIARVYASYKPDLTWQISAIGGYEDNHFFLTRERGTTYGVSGIWRPGPRTNLSAAWEHRFFGSSYHVAFDHHTPLTVWSVNASRDITSAPQQLANLPAGADVDALLNSLFGSRVPDAAQRQLLVDQLIRDRNLPAQLTGPVPIFAQRIMLVEDYSATYGILGARNSILFRIFRFRNEPVEGSEPALSPLLELLSNTTQTGVGVTWTHTLAPNLTLSVAGNASTAKQNTESSRDTRLYAVRATVSRTLSPRTSVHAGARFQRGLSDSELGASYHEFAVLAGFSYSFR